MEQVENRFGNVLTAPYVSIIIPVYNVEKTLYSCLVSAVFQTLSETEIIVVNDATQDNSQEIIDEFVAMFPNKVKCVIHEQNQGLAYARRTGLCHAVAPYVIFLDSDDFISGDLCQEILTKMLMEDLDLAYYPALRCWESDSKCEVLYPPKDNNQSNMIKNGWAAFWGAMYRRDFLLAHQDIAFLPMLFEDAASTPAILSHTDKIGVYRKRALYFYRFGRQGSICAQQMTARKMRDTFCADMIGLKNVKPEQQTAYAVRALNRASNTLWKESSIYDYSVAHVKRLCGLTDHCQIAVSPNSKRIIDHAMSLPDKILIPKIVFVNGFVRESLKDFDLYLTEAHRAYLFDPEVVVLDTSNCDVSLLPAWLKDASSEEKGLYFAVRSICEQGGIYISPAVRIVTSFNREAFRGAFFVAGDNTTVLPCVFGAEPGNPLLQAMQVAIEREQTAWRRDGVADCMARVLIGESGVHLNGRDEYGLHQLHMLAFSDVFRKEKSERSYCILDYNNYKGTSDDMLCVPQHLNDFAWKLAAQRLDTALSQKEAAEKEKKNAEKAASDAKKKAATVQKEFNRFRKTRLYKFAKRIHDLLPERLRKLLWK